MLKMFISRLYKFAIAAGILILICGSIYAIFKFNETNKTKETGSRVYAAFNDIGVYVKTCADELSDADEFTAVKLNRFIQQPATDFFPSIEMTVDFAQVYDNINENDVAALNGKFIDYERNVYDRLGLLFDKTDNLVIRIINNDAGIADVGVPDNAGIANKSSIHEFFMPVKRFLKTGSKSLRIETAHCVIYIDSDFFYGGAVREDGTRELALPDADMQLYFKLDESDADNVIAEIFLIDSQSNMIMYENPGKSILMRVPLSLDSMRDSRAGDGGLRFDAAEYIDTVYNVVGILPRSFADSRYLNISANRTGIYRLVKTTSGKAIEKAVDDDIDVKADFLMGRGIEPGANAGQTVKRGDFLAALMRIFWTESLKYGGGVVPFPDEINNDEMRMMINTAKRLGVLVGNKPAAPNGKIEFRPDDALMREHMFVILERFVYSFDIKAKGLFPADGDAKWSPANKVNWRDAADSYINLLKDDYVSYRESVVNTIANLENLGFLPYRAIGGINYISANEPVSYGEAVDLLYRLATSIDF